MFILHLIALHLSLRYLLVKRIIKVRMIMSTIQIRVDEQLKKEAYQAFEKLNLSPSEALRLFLRYVAENEKLPFSEVSIVVSENDDDDAILAVVRERLKKPAKRVRVSLDDI